MEKVYLVIVGILFLLAISDLIVGVSNDAVNFLNSAIGAKVAPLRVILIVAAVGILFGATFSSGMMEVARKGIFNPGNFYFNEIMIIFLAVMLTDIILLDLFNTFGLPTSTTVSIVFELLGAAVGISLIKISNLADGCYTDMTQYINSSKALAIIAGILLSVVVAFSVGAIVQYISRLIFSFNMKKPLKYFGAIWGGFAITSITYFILIKGAKGSSFMNASTVTFIKENTFYIILVSLGAWTVLLQILNMLFNLNILKFTVLAGTFALAMAFAGNDLVNFIGVPLAGYESYKTFVSTEGISAETFSMISLAGQVKTPTLYLLIAGLIMVITLWISRKAKSVVRTTLNLSDQDEVNERFESNAIARSLVRMSMVLNNGMKRVLPTPFVDKIQQRFEKKYFKEYVQKNPGVSFDLLRASVNLVVAAVLIAFATSLKLPLSTTYVTFMVAMGTSLADGAWGRESAVYRITGVVTVVGGWFVTAISAFTAALLTAIFLYYTFPYGIIVYVGLVFFVIFRSHLSFNKKELQNSKNEEILKRSMTEDASLYETSIENISSILLASVKSMEITIKALIKEDRRKLRIQFKEVKQFDKEVKQLKKRVPDSLKVMTDDKVEAAHVYIEIIDYLKETMNALTHFIGPVYKHIDNNHTTLTEHQAESQLQIIETLNTYIETLVKSISDSDYSNANSIIDKSKDIVEQIIKTRKKNLKLIKKHAGSTRTNILFFDMLNESKNFTLFVNNIYKAFRDFSQVRGDLYK